MSTILRTIAVAGLVIGGIACGEEEATVRTAEELAASLIDVDTFEGDWSMSAPDEFREAAESGVVPDDMRDMLPSMDLCDAASDESRAAAEGLRWMAFRQLDLTVDDPIEPPDDRSGNMVSAQEYLLSTEPDEIEATYELLQAGLEACLGEIEAGEEGPGMAEAMPLPEVGDDRYGVLVTVAEAGGWAEWRLHTALVRDGAVLAQIVITDIRAGVDPYYTVDDVGEMVTTAIDLL